MSKGSVLLAEDNEDFRLHMQTALEKSGFTVVPFPDGTKLQKHLDMIKTGNATLPSAIILDQTMAKRGSLVAAEIRQNDNKTPIILLQLKNLPHVVPDFAKAINIAVLDKQEIRTDSAKLTDAVDSLVAKAATPAPVSTTRGQ